MPQIAPIVVTFGTPSIQNELTLEPIGNDKGLTSYAGSILKTDVGAGTVVEMTKSAALQPTLTISLSRPSKTSRISKARVKLVVPVAALDALGNPTGVKSHENSADTTYLFSEKSTEQERKDLDFCMQELIVSQPIHDVIQKLKSMY